MQAEAKTQSNGSANVLGQDYSHVSDEFDLGDETVLGIEGVSGFSERNRLLFNYFDYDWNRPATLDDDVQLDDFNFAASSSAMARVKFPLANLAYDCAIVETPIVSACRSVRNGQSWKAGPMPMRAPKASARESRNDHARSSARWTANTRDEKWRFLLQEQYLDAKCADQETAKAPALPGLLPCVARLGALLISSWEYTGR